jgi:hypothetical protein
MKKVNHDVKPGKLDRCQITGSTNLFEAIDLGHQPSAGALLTKEGLHEPETLYPLRLMISPESGLGQLDYVVDSKVLFSGTQYMYRTGISAPLVEHLKHLCEEIIRSQQIPQGSLCVDVGCNDGTLLKHFKNQGMQVLGVEPTNMAKVARKENRIHAIQDFFTEDVARKIVGKHGKAKIVTFTNVFAHVAALGSVMRGLSKLLDKEGTLVTESQYLLDVFEGNQFDQIYHEHVRIYSLRALTKLFPYYGMEVFDAKRVPTREGSIRVYVGWKGKHPVSESVQRLLDAEEKEGLFSEDAWVKWRKRVEKNKFNFLELALKIKKDGGKLVADSCPTRGVVLMNYYGLGTDLIPYISQLPQTEKVGKYMAGTHNPILSNDILLKEQPEYILILAWHYADFIIKNWRAKGLKSKFVVPLPEFRIVES